jgi:F-type H+-transporting ATPase subunit b
MTVLWQRAVLFLSVCFVIAVSSSWTSADEKANPATALATEAHGDDHAVAHDEAGHDAHGGHSDPEGTPPLLQFDAGSAIANIAIFIGVLLILSKLVWPVILDGLKARETKIRSDLESADKAHQEAKALLAGYQAKLDEASAQVQAMLAEAHKSGEAAGQRIVEEAKAEAERQRVRALADIETAKKVAIADLAGQTSDLAMQVARKVVGRELKASDHGDLIRQSLDRLSNNN